MPDENELPCPQGCEFGRSDCGCYLALTTERDALRDENERLREALKCARDTVSDFADGHLVLVAAQTAYRKGAIEDLALIDAALGDSDGV